MRDLGYCNGWVENPTIVDDCVDVLGHTPEREAIGTTGTLERVFCKLCDYEYLIDSSD